MFVVQARALDPSSPFVAEVAAEVRSCVEGVLPQVDTTEWIDAIEGIEGWLTSAEATLLARCVAAAPTGGGSVIVEIGSFKGRSTLLLALAVSQLGIPLTVVAVDPHTGYHFRGGEDTYEALLETLEAAGVASLVDVRRVRSTDVNLDVPIALAYVDGLHDCDSVRADHATVARKLVVGGLAVFHDYVEFFPGVIEAVNELLCGDEYELAGWCESLIALRRV